MNRNTEAHFSKLPNVKIQRSLFDRSTQNKLSFNAGLLIPIFVDEYLPGDTFTMDTSIVIRTSSPFIKPIMDNLYADIYYFSVPNRLVWEHWKQFMGENKDTNNPWIAQTEYTIPQTTSPTAGWTAGGVADYLGIPINISGLSVSSLFFRAYVLIWNEYFRDQNIIVAQTISMGDGTTGGSNGTGLNNAIQGGRPLPVCKFHDYFTSALPSAQKGNPIEINLAAGTIPVYGNGKGLALTSSGSDLEYLTSYIDSTPAEGTTAEKFAASRTIFSNSNIKNKDTGDINTISYQAIGGQSAPKVLGLPTKTELGATNLANSGVIADLDVVQGITINQLREAFALQRLLEKDARGGTRYTEVIKSHFNVNSPDARQQRPEYLGGKRIPINIDQVVQMSGTENSSGPQQTAQANVAAYSLTTDKSSSFTKSFTEHGMILGLMCVRQEHTYQQGLNRMFSRKRRYDYYWPSLANLGETPILSKEIYATGNSTIDNQAFGFQEVWAEYRYKPSTICGNMRSAASNPLAVYHLGDFYTTNPTLSTTWIIETKDNLDRTLAINSSSLPQFIADIYFTYRCARPMPTYSVPGLMDHF